MTQTNRPNTNQAPVTRRQAPGQNPSQMNSARRLTVRTALAAGATIATLIGAQNLVFLDKLNAITALNTITSGDTSTAATGDTSANVVVSNNTGVSQNPVAYSVTQTIPTTVPQATSTPGIIVQSTVAAAAPNIIIVRNSVAASSVVATNTNVITQATDIPSVTSVVLPTTVPTIIPSVTPIPTQVPVYVAPVQSQPRPRTKSS